MNIRTSTELPCTAQRAFDAWLSEKDHSNMVSDHPKCTFDVKAGGEWRIDSLEGTFIDINRQDLKIVMNWRYTDGWEDNEYSKLTVEFVPASKTACTIKLSQTDVPEELAEEVKSGWDDYYFEGMKEFFSK